MVEAKKQQPTSRCFHNTCFTCSTFHDHLSDKKPGGWKAMPYLLGNETFEKLASFGLLANFMVYLKAKFHMNQVLATNVIYIWSGVTNFAPLSGAFISDAYAGRFRTIAFASFASLLGMIIITLTAWLPQLHPPPCSIPQHDQPHQVQCIAPPSTNSQLAILLTGLAFLSIGSGGIRPCSIPFGIDQFNPTTEEGKKGINSFFFYYYATLTFGLLISKTVVVYIQDSISWVLGFGIPTLLMVCSIVLFFVGTRVYVHVKPEGSMFSGIAQVVVAAYKKRKRIELGEDDDQIDYKRFYDPPLQRSHAKLHLTNQFRFLNKAAIIFDVDELNPDGTRVNKWTLSSVQQVEELKCLIRIIPIWVTCIFSLTSLVQEPTFTVLQALQMNRHLVPGFEIPPGSMGVISLITIALWLPLYGRVIVPRLQKLTKHETGITMLQRLGIGIVFSILSMSVAGVIEHKRRASVVQRSEKVFHPTVAPISVMWLAPQLILMGICEAFSMTGQIEFFNKQFPEHMRSVANSLLPCSIGLASFVSSLMVTIVQGVTGGKRGGRHGWLEDDLNEGRLDYFYYLIAGMGVLNLVYFVYFANQYRYKECNLEVVEDVEPYVGDYELY